MNPVYLAARANGHGAAAARALARIADAARASAEDGGREVEVACGRGLEVDSVRLALYAAARMEVHAPAGPVGDVLTGTAPGKRPWRIRLIDKPSLSRLME